MKVAAENSSSFGSASNFAWLGTVSGSRFAWYAYADGSIYYNYLQFEDFAIAPAFNLDLSKVEIKGDEIIKKEQLAPLSFEQDDNCQEHQLLGKTYKFAGYNWTACELINNGKTLVIQSHGVTCGTWPGFKMLKFGGKANGMYGLDIAGEDISAYDNKMKELYDDIKEVEDTSATYGKGLYLVSKEKAGFARWGQPGSGNCWQALKKAAENVSQFGFPNYNVWLSTVFCSNYTWFINSDGNFYGSYQNNDFAIAPAFNLDLSKVEIAGDEIIKKAKFDFVSMALTTPSDSSKELTDSSQYRSVWGYGMNLTKDGETFHLDPEMISQIFEAIKEDNGRNYVATYTSRKFSREQYIAICDEVENLLANESEDVKYHACEQILGVGFDNYTGQSASDDTPKKMDLSSFNDAQMREIHSGLEENLDVTIYAKPEFTSDQMAEIRQGLDGKLDVTIYAKLEYTRDQMVEIRLGLERKLDVTIYAKPEYTWDQMAEIRRGLVENLDVSIYAKPEYDAYQMKEIHHGLVENLDVAIYAKPEYGWEQMEEIRMGLKKNLDVTLYAKPEYNCNQMEEIRLGLEAGLDVSVYTKPEYDHNQMKEIRLGLVNVSGNTPKKLDL